MTLSHSELPVPAKSRRFTSTDEQGHSFLSPPLSQEMMNPRRVHELITANFPAVEIVTLDWVNVLESDGTFRSEIFYALIGEFICGDDILVEVNRKVGDLKTKDQIIPYVQEHVGKGQIRKADRDFQGYVLIGMNGVAAGWSST